MYVRQWFLLTLQTQGHTLNTLRAGWQYSSVDKMSEVCAEEPRLVLLCQHSNAMPCNSWDASLHVIQGLWQSGQVVIMPRKVWKYSERVQLV